MLVVKKITNKIKVLLLFIILFPGMVKMVIGYTSSLINIVPFFILLLFVINSKKKKYQILFERKMNLTFVYLMLFIALMITIYFSFSLSQLDFLSIQYFIKAWLFLLTSIILFYFFKENDFNTLVNIIVVFSVISTIMMNLGAIDYDRTKTNYLIYAFLLGLSMIFLFFDYLFIKANIFLIAMVLYFGLMSLFSGSRGALLFAGLIMLFLIIIKMRKVGLLKKIFIAGVLYMSVYVIVVFALPKIEINSWLQYKMLRLFSSDVSEEPRYELYANVFKYFENNFSFYGFGFHASRNISTSWDPRLPYLESFPLELVFNYGIFGLLVILYQVLFVITFLKKNIYKYRNTFKSFLMFLFVYLNFSKGWSVYNGFVVFPLMAITLIVYTYESGNFFRSSDTEQLNYL